jgi:hypothetical protein
LAAKYAASCFRSCAPVFACAARTSSKVAKGLTGCRSARVSKPGALSTSGTVTTVWPLVKNSTEPLDGAAFT